MTAKKEFGRIVVRGVNSPIVEANREKIQKLWDAAKPVPAPLEITLVSDLPCGLRSIKTNGPVILVCKMTGQDI